jgi:hypothetical protein
MRISEAVMLSAATHPGILAGAKKKKMQGFFTSLRFVQNDRRPVLCTDIWRCVFSGAWTTVDRKHRPG